MMKRVRVAALAAAFGMMALAGGAQAQMVDKKGLTLEAAKKIAAAAEAEAVKNKWNVVIVVVDEGGQIVYLQRMDGTQYGSVNVAIAKAMVMPSAMPIRPPQVDIATASIRN